LGKSSFSSDFKDHFKSFFKFSFFNNPEIFRSKQIIKKNLLFLKKDLKENVNESGIENLGTDFMLRDMGRGNFRFSRRFAWLFRHYIWASRVPSFPDRRANVVDLGCDVGEIRMLMSRAFYTKTPYYVGIDIDNERLSAGANEIFTRIPAIYVQYDLTLGFPFIKDNSVDLVFMGETIEHFKKEFAVVILKEVYRILKDNGRILISTPNKKNSKGYDFHVYEFTVEELKEEVMKTGLSVDKTWGWVSTEHVIRENASKEVNDLFSIFSRRSHKDLILPIFSHLDPNLADAFCLEAVKGEVPKTEEEIIFPEYIVKEEEPSPILESPAVSSVVEEKKIIIPDNRPLKIALMIYPINDYGGIIGHAENLAFGLRELGHTVHLKILYWQENFASRSFNEDQAMEKDGWSIGAFCPVHPCLGWYPENYVNKFPYKGKESGKILMEDLSGYDIVIWEVPVPTKQGVNYGNHSWLKLYKACSKNIAVIHDGNIENIPWISKIKDNLVGLACVHECAYNKASVLDVPRAMILNPQNLTGMEKLYDYYDKKKGFLTLQVFKGWKHVDDVIRSIPYLPPSGFAKLVAGGGIEQRYMVSDEKIKPRYVCATKYDPDLISSLSGRKISIWQRALWNDMEYFGFISEGKRDFLLRQVRTLIDPSWSKSYSKSGSHFNRVVVDAMKMGVIPIAVNLGMSSDESGESSLFVPDKNYIMIPYNSSPKEYASIIEYASNLPSSMVFDMVERNYELVKHFDRRKIAQDFINLAKGRGCGFFNKRIKAKVSDESFIISGKKEFKSFFKPKNKTFKEKEKIED